MISAVILTKNEEKNIERCFTYVSWCDEIIVVDDFSEDRTVNIMENGEWRMENDNAKIKIYKRHLSGDFGTQRNYGLDKATDDWVLFIDADEIVPEELKREILEKIKSAKNVNGYYFKRKDFFLGKWLEHGETSRVKLLRLVRKNTGRWEGKIHEKWRVMGKTYDMQHALFHYPHPTVADFLRKINSYTDIVAQYWIEQGRKIHGWEIICFPFGKFIQNYIIRCGFLDGSAGLIMAVMMSFHSFLARGKLWQINHR